MTDNSNYPKLHTYAYISDKESGKWERCWYGYRPLIWTWAWLATYIFLSLPIIITATMGQVGGVASRLWHHLDRPIRRTVPPTRTGLTTCSRCNWVFPAEDAESCFWCTGDLCPVCWDEFGHCGHEEAERAAEIARQAGQALAEMPGSAIIEALRQ